MRNRHLFLAALCLGALIAMARVFAHHSAFAFDTGTTQTIKGAIAEWSWANPHCLLKLDVTAENGEVVQWVVETQAPANMIEAGWRKNDLKPGNVVAVTLNPARNGSLAGRLLRVEFADGRTLQVGGNEAAADEYNLSGAPNRLQPRPIAADQ